MLILCELFFGGMEAMSSFELGGGSIASVVGDKLPLRRGSPSSFLGVDRTGTTCIGIVMIAVELPVINRCHIFLELGAIMKKPGDTVMPGLCSSRRNYEKF